MESLRDLLGKPFAISLGSQIYVNCRKGGTIESRARITNPSDRQLASIIAWRSSCPTECRGSVDSRVLPTLQLFRSIRSPRRVYPGVDPLRHVGRCLFLKPSA